MVAWYYTLIRSAHSLLRGFTGILFIFLSGPFILSLCLTDYTAFTILAMGGQMTASVLLLKSANFRVTGEIIIS